MDAPRPNKRRRTDPTPAASRREDTPMDAILARIHERNLQPKTPAEQAADQAAAQQWMQSICASTSRYRAGEAASGGGGSSEIKKTALSAGVGAGAGAAEATPSVAAEGSDLDSVGQDGAVSTKRPRNDALVALAAQHGAEGAEAGAATEPS